MGNIATTKMLKYDFVYVVGSAETTTSTDCLMASLVRHSRVSGVFMAVLISTFPQLLLLLPSLLFLRSHQSHAES